MPIHSVLIQKLLTTNAHLAHRAATHSFKPYLYATRNTLSIIDSDKTLISLRTAISFISNLARTPSSRFLFVNTNPNFDPIFDKLTLRIGYGSFTAKSNQYWKLGGFLTNSASPKKFRSRNKKLCFGPVHPPDCVVIVDTEWKSSVVKEAARLNIPVVALVGSNVPRDVFEKITYPIPCNDSTQFVYLFCNLIAKTLLLEQKGMERKVVDDLVLDVVSSEKVKLEEINQSEDDTKQLEESNPSEDDAKQLEASNQSADEMKVKLEESNQSADETVFPYAA